MKHALLASACLVLCACQGNAALYPDAAPPPGPGRFSVCHNHGCAYNDTIGLTPEEWRQVRAAFSPPATDAPQERRQIARAIGLMERLVGARTGTENDKGGTFPGAFRSGQMDCIDEASNTTTYLRLMRADGLMRRHAVEAPATRGYFLFGWPHTTAVVRDAATGERFAVDSWFFDNGVEPAVVPLEQWRGGWSPPAAER